MQELKCDRCNKYMGTMAAGSRFRNGMVVFCLPCDQDIKRKLEPVSSDVPEFLRGFMKGGKHAR